MSISLDGPECRHGWSLFNPNPCLRCQERHKLEYSVCTNTTVDKISGCDYIPVCWNIGVSCKCVEQGKILAMEPERSVAVPVKKDTNPKDAVGVRKPRWFSYIPVRVMMLVGLALLEGARKYGRHNYREAGVRASVYVDAAVCGHLGPWWEGQDNDPDTGLNHIDKAIASLVVLRDGMLEGNWVDDRPPRAQDWDKFYAETQKRAIEIIERIPNAVEPYTEERRKAKEALSFPSKP